MQVHRTGARFIALSKRLHLVDLHDRPFFSRHPGISVGTRRHGALVSVNTGLEVDTSTGLEFDTPAASSLLKVTSVLLRFQVVIEASVPA